MASLSNLKYIKRFCDFVSNSNILRRENISCIYDDHIGKKNVFKRNISCCQPMLARKFYDEIDVERISVECIKSVRPDHDVTIHSKFYEDLDFNDFDKIDMILKLEIHFGILLLDKVVVESEYVRDVTWELFRRLMVLSATMLTEGCLWEPDDRVRALGRIYPFDEH